MIISERSLHEKVISFIGRNLKIILICLGITFLGILTISTISAQAKDVCIEFTNIIKEAQICEEKKQYSQAIILIDKIKERKLNQNEKMLLLVYKYKIYSLANHNQKTKLEQDIKDVKYISQHFDYSEFSFFGEFLLLNKMVLHYNAKEYQVCVDMLLNKHMQRLPYHVSTIIRAQAFMKLHNQYNGYASIQQWILYHSDSSKNKIFKELCVKYLASLS